MQELIELIGQYGFPIFVCIWFMFRTEKIIAENTSAIIKLTVLVEKLVDKLG